MSEQNFNVEDAVMMLMLVAVSEGFIHLLDGMEKGEVDIVCDVRFKILEEL